MSFIFLILDGAKWCKFGFLQDFKYRILWLYFGRMMFYCNVASWRASIAADCSRNFFISGIRFSWFVINIYDTHIPETKFDYLQLSNYPEIYLIIYCDYILSHILKTLTYLTWGHTFMMKLEHDFQGNCNF